MIDRASWMGLRCGVPNPVLAASLILAPLASMTHSPRASSRETVSLAPSLSTPKVSVMNWW